MAASYKVRSPSPTQTQLNPLYASVQTDAVTRHRGVGLPGEISRAHNHSSGPHYDEATITKDNQNPVYGERFELDDRSGSKTNIALTTKDENKPLCQYCSFVLALILGIFALLVSFVAIVLCCLVVGGALVDKEDVVVGLRNSIASLQSAVSGLDNSTSCVNVSGVVETVTETVMLPQTTPSPPNTTSLRTWNLNDCNRIDENCSIVDTSCNISDNYMHPVATHKVKTEDLTVITVEIACWITTPGPASYAYYSVQGGVLNCECRGSGMCHYHRLYCNITTYQIVEV